MQATYTKLEARYGKRTAIAIIGAGVLGLPLPIPGSSFVTAAPVIALAEIYKVFTGGREKSMDTEELSQEEIEKLGKQLVEELLADWEEEHDDDDE